MFIFCRTIVRAVFPFIGKRGVTECKCYSYKRTCIYWTFSCVLLLVSNVTNEQMSFFIWILFIIAAPRKAINPLRSNALLGIKEDVKILFWRQGSKRSVFEKTEDYDSRCIYIFEGYMWRGNNKPEVISIGWNFVKRSCEKITYDHIKLINIRIMTHSCQSISTLKFMCCC